MPNRFQDLLRNKNSRMAKSTPKEMQTGLDSMEMPNLPMIQPTQLRVGSGQSIGLQRDHNEDTLYTFSSVLSAGEKAEIFGFFIIADGMGGHQHGEIASRVSVNVVVRYIMNHFYDGPYDASQPSSPVSIQEVLSGAVNEAQKSVLHYAPGGGTTITIAMMLGDQLTICHVGDSRAYFIMPDGSLQRITRDHSLVQRLVDLHEITESEAEVHPQKNVLLRAIGQSDPFVPDIQMLQFPKDARLMLCSDGLWGVVGEKLISTMLRNDQDPILSCQKLVDAANKEGGPDNISVILVQKTDEI